MNKLLLLALLAAGAAGAQTPTPEPEKKPRPLNLRIDDDAPRAAPRITFETKEEKTAPTNLPGLGAGARTVEQTTRRVESSSPYPKDTAPGR